MECIICKNGMRHLTDDLYICDDCELISSIVSPDPSIYDRSYEIKYSRYESTVIGEQIQAERNRIVTKHLPDTNYVLRLLDLGCGVGTFVRKSDLPKVELFGFDINPYGDYCDIAVLRNNYDILTFWDSLEHLEDPGRIINGFNPELVFVCTPSVDDFHLSTKHLTQWRHYMPQEHCHYFSSNSIIRLFNACEYDVREINYNESKYRKGGGEKNIMTVVAEKEERDGQD